MPGVARLSRVQTPEIPPMQKALKRERFRACKCTGARHAAAWCNLLSSRLYCRLRSFTESTLRFVGCNHRWGISPRPEDWYFVGRDYTAALFAVSIRNPKKFARGVKCSWNGAAVEILDQKEDQEWTGQGFLDGKISFFRQHLALGRTGRYSRSMSASSACCSRARCI